MTDDEILELPKAWVVGGDGGMGDIGYQNVSKVMLQNRPNVKAVMLDTQVYSNTGGQNSDSTPMLGGNDMNVFGAATQGKTHEKKTVAETFLAGHGSPFVAQISIANAPKLYRAILDGIEYRGTAFLQCFTSCQPEHGVPDDMALTQAQRVRDSRGAPEVRLQPTARRNRIRRRSISRATRQRISTGTRRRSRAARAIATRLLTGARPRRASAII
jgi:pyruvate-ferredoxin/flavodoxin oxidoreductase